MIDIHTHLLYGVDDGSESLEESIAIIRLAAKQGVTGMVATPHHIKGAVENNPESLIEKLSIIQKRLKDDQIKVDLYLGNEVYLDFDILNDCEAGRCLSINKSRYILIELPFNSKLNRLDDLLFELRLQGYLPILAHPERYDFIQRDLTALEKLIEQNVLIQMNLGSLLGKYGKSVQKTAHEMVKRQMVHLIGSDVHRKNSDLQDYEKALSILKKYSDHLVFDQITKSFPNAVLENKDLTLFKPKLKKRKWIKRLVVAVLLFAIMIGSGLYYGYKKVEAQFEAAMIEQAKQVVAAQEAAELKAKEEADRLAAEGKVAREAERESQRQARIEQQKIEDQRIIAFKQRIDEKIKAEEAATAAAIEAARDEAEKIALEEAAQQRREELERQKLEAEKAQAALEKKRLEEEERLALEAAEEEARIEAERLEAERIAAEEKARMEAELEAQYTDYESDKAKALDLALSKLTVDQVNRLIQLSAGGFDPEEKAEAKEMFYSNFTPEEQNWILEMYVKYYGS